MKTPNTTRKQSLRRLCFHRCLSVHRGEYLGRYPPGQVHPPATVHAGIRSTSGWYASHWNAFLLNINIVVGIQWRIQDFPQGGRQLPKLLLFFTFLPKTAWKWKNLDPQGGARVPGAPPWIRQWYRLRLSIDEKAIVWAAKTGLVRDCWLSFSPSPKINMAGGTRSAKYASVEIV